MNDLDDLIRTSLRDHTPVAPTDDNLADQVTAAGRRIRRTRATGAAALALVIVVGLAWGWAALPLLTQQGIAALPTMSQPTPSQPVPSVDPAVRDVSGTGNPEGWNYTGPLDNYFASPTGNFHCFISSAGAGCAGEKWDKGVKPSKKICQGVGSVIGPELRGAAAAAWACDVDPHSMPFLSSAGADGVTWWDPAFGESIPDPSDPSTRLAVLPYGKTLVAGDFSCSMAKDGVTCSNSLSGYGFHVSRSRVDLQR